MNIAFGTLIIILFLLPGFAFSRLYYSGVFSKNFIRVTPLEILIGVVLPSLFFHFIGNLLSTHLFGLEISFSYLGILLYGVEGELLPVFEKIEAYQGPILAYVIAIPGLAAVAGIGVKSIVRRFKLDRSIRYLRFQNEWYYMLSGELLEIQRVVKSAKQTIDFKYIDALVEFQGKAYIYSGLLVHYLLDDKKGIDHIVLSETTIQPVDKISLSGPPNNIKAQQPDVASIFVIPYDKVLNMHISYYNLEILHHATKQKKNPAGDA